MITQTLVHLLYFPGRLSHLWSHCRARAVEANILRVGEGRWGWRREGKMRSSSPDGVVLIICRSRRRDFWGGYFRQQRISLILKWLLPVQSKGFVSFNTYIQKIIIFTIILHQWPVWSRHIWNISGWNSFTFLHIISSNQQNCLYSHVSRPLDKPTPTRGRWPRTGRAVRSLSSRSRPVRRPTTNRGSWSCKMNSARRETSSPTPSLRMNAWPPSPKRRER